MTELGSIIKTARERHEITLREAEEQCGVSNSYLSQIENGKIKKPSPDILNKLSLFYQIPYEMLLEKAGYPRSSYGTDTANSSGEIALNRHSVEKKLKQETGERNKAEETLREIEKSLHEAYKLAHIGAWDWKADTDTVTWTEELYRIAGLDPLLPAPTYTEHSTIYTPESWKVLKTAVERAMETGETYQLELELLRPDGSTRCVNAFCGVKYATSGHLNGLYGIVQDITERKRAEEALKESERFLASTLDGLSSHIAVIDASGEIVLTNRAYRNFAAQNGVDPCAVSEGTNYIAICDAARGEGSDEAALFGEAIRRVLDGSCPSFELEYPCHSPDKKRWFIGRVTPFQGDGPRRAVVAHEDITERKRADEALRASEEQYRLLSESSFDAIYVITRDDTIEYVNETGAKMLGFSRGDIIGKPRSDFFTKKIAGDQLRQLDEVFTSGKPSFYETPATFREMVSWQNTHLVPLKDEAGNTDRVLGISRDVTEKKQSELEIRELSLHLITIQEEERQRVARDLHDSVGQTVLAAKLNIEAYLKNKSDMDRLGKGLSFLDRASQELRSIYTGLYPSILDDLGLEAAVRWYAKHYLEANGISASLDIALEAEIRHDMAVNLYRIIQEVLSNVLKHSGADSLRLKLYEKSGVITMTVRDKGIGFDRKAIGLDKFGLVGLRYRARLMGGECIIDSKEGEGTTITVTAMRAAP